MIKPHYRVFACFFLFAFALGALLARLADVQQNLGLDKAQLGLMLIGMAIGSLVSVSIGAQWVDRMGARLTAIVTVLGTAFCYALILAPDPKMWTIMVYIFQLRSGVDFPVVYASLMITAIPTLLVFIFCQNIILRGIVVPSDK